MKYESLITCHLKDTANVKVFEKWVKHQGQDHKVKNFLTETQTGTVTLDYKAIHQILIL
jgi:hypothetical protein